MPAFEMQLAQIWRYREKCAGTNRDGSPCQMFRRSGSKYCHTHRGGMRNDRCSSCGKTCTYGSECSPCRSARLKREGKCVACWKYLDDPSRARCTSCAKKNRLSKRKSRAA